MLGHSEGMKTSFRYIVKTTALFIAAFACHSPFAAEMSAAKQAQKERLKYAAKILEEDCSKLEARKISDELAASVLYQISLRTFTAQGTLKEAQKMLPHLKNLGVDVLYLCPINLSDDDTDKRFWSKGQKKFGFPKNPYRIKDYETIDPEYGTPEDLKNFVDAAHSNGIRVLLDAVFYHCGPKTTLAKINPDFIRRDDSGEMILGRWNFPEINYDNPELRRYMCKVLADFVRKYDVDGYRTDAEWFVPPSFWEEAARELRAIKPDIIMLAESERPRAQVSAYDANYSYRYQDALAEVFGEGKSAANIVEVERKNRALFPKGSRQIRTRENHDTAYVAENKRPDNAWKNGAFEASFVLSFMLDGIPMIYNGNEIADGSKHNLFHNRFFGKTSLDWSNALTPKGTERFAFMKKLIDLRKKTPALFKGETIWLENSAPDSAITFVRKHGNRAYAVVINAGERQIEISATLGGMKTSKILSMPLSKTAECLVSGNSVKAKLGGFGYAVVELGL